MKKCKTCIWADWRSGTKVFCPFPSCVKEKNIGGGERLDYGQSTRPEQGQSPRDMDTS
jgi:hypothetical protein